MCFFPEPQGHGSLRPTLWRFSFADDMGGFARASRLRCNDPDMFRDEIGREVCQVLVDLHGVYVIWVACGFPEPSEHEPGALKIGVFVSIL